MRVQNHAIVWPETLVRARWLSWALWEFRSAQVFFKKRRTFKDLALVWPLTLVFSFWLLQGILKDFELVSRYMQKGFKAYLLIIWCSKYCQLSFSAVQMITINLYGFFFLFFFSFFSQLWIPLVRKEPCNLQTLTGYRLKTRVKLGTELLFFVINIHVYMSSEVMLVKIHFWCRLVNVSWTSIP